jgi:hypothetical protein
MITLAKDYIKLTPAQLTLLEHLLTDTSITSGYIYGAGQVKAARKLEALGLVSITDDGEAPMGGDGETHGALWYVARSHGADRRAQVDSCVGRR